VLLLDAAYLSAFSTLGWVVIAALVITAFLSAIALALVVERMKKSLDFACTLYFLHVVVVSLVTAFPWNGTWWLVHTVCWVITAALGEYLCREREMHSDISVEELLRGRTTRARQDSSAVAAAALPSGAIAVSVPSVSDRGGGSQRSLASNVSAALSQAIDRLNFTARESSGAAGRDGQSGILLRRGASQRPMAGGASSALASYGRVPTEEAWDLAISPGSSRALPGGITPRVPRAGSGGAGESPVKDGREKEAAGGSGGAASAVPSVGRRLSLGGFKAEG